MLQRIDITGVHYTVEPNLQKYVTQKLGNLDKYLPRASRQSTHLEVKLKESKAKDKKQCMCEVILHAPHETIAVKESTLNMFAAVDIVEEKLKHQLKKYKELQSSHKLHRKVIARFRRRTA
jgi:putative sigma-54 modulation protein